MHQSKVLSLSTPTAPIHKMSKHSRINKRTRRASSKNSDKFNHQLFSVVLLISVLLITGFIYRFVSLEIIPLLETSKTDVVKLPLAIEKKFKKESQGLATFRVPILLYHYVEYVQDKRDTIRQSLDINPGVFESQVKTLSDAGYTFITARELGQVLDGKANLPKKPILLTFDDGHWDLDTDVLPILKKYHAKATAYIIPGFLGGSDFLSPDQLRDVIASGLVEIGAHTVHHVSLTNKFLPVVQYEVSQSKAMLEKDYHLLVVSFAYPGGAFDQQAINVVKNSKFSTAVSTIPGIAQSTANRFFLYRLRPGYLTGDSLLHYISQSTFSLYAPSKY